MNQEEEAGLGESLLLDSRWDLLNTKIVQNL